MVLVLIPCADIHATTSPTGENISIAADHEDFPHENESDFCSPFCICSCCGQTSLIGQDGHPVRKTFLIAAQEPMLFIYETQWASEYLDRLFHPPKV